jgi:DNA-binding PadR family transcriptional regulator
LNDKNEIKTQRPPQKAFRLSDEGRELLVALSRRLGVNQTAVIELAIRDKAKAENIRPDSSQEQQAAV